MLERRGMMVILAEFCVVIHILFEIFVGFMCFNIVISCCGDLSCLLIVSVSCDVPIMVSPAILEICIPVFCLWWGCDPADWLSCTAISSIPSSEPSSEELIVIIVGVCIFWAVVPWVEGFCQPMIVIWVLLGCA